MPSTSKKQHNFMAMVANDPAAAKRTGVPQSVGQEYMKADKGLKFGKGSGTRADLQKINRPKTDQGKSELFSKGGDMKESKAMLGKEMAFMKKKGAPKSMIKHEMAEAGMKKMADGGYTGSGGRGIVEMPGDKTLNSPKRYATKILPSSMPPLTKSNDKAKGGMISMGKVKTAAPSRDGIASKGKTKGKMVKMAYGGKSC